MNDARTSVLVQALTGPEQLSQLQVRTGIVRAVNLAVTPHVITVDIGGVSIGDLSYLAGWDVEVGATVMVLQQGPVLLVLGPLAPARQIVGAHNHTTPPVNPPSPPAPPVIPAAPTVTRTVTVRADTSSTWVPTSGTWRAEGVFQGGTGQRGYWFYGTKIADAKGTGTIVAGTILIRRTALGGRSGTANIRLGTHTFLTRPDQIPALPWNGAEAWVGAESWSAAPLGTLALSNVTQSGALNLSQGMTVVLTVAQIAALNAGASGFGLEPGAAGFITPDYLVAVPRTSGDWSGALALTIEG